MSFLGSVFSGASNNYAPAGQQQNLIQAQTANTNYGQANTGLNQLAQALQAQMTGGGPNLANQQLQNATAQNVNTQAALMAGRRGASSNPGLEARQIAQQGAGLQQQAAGQSASNVLAQQLAAQQQLGNVYGTQGSLANQNYGVAQGGTNAANEQGNKAAGQNAQMNQGLMGGIANAGMALLADGGEADDAQQQPNVIPGFSKANFGFNFVNQQPPNTMAKPNAAIPQGTHNFYQNYAQPMAPIQSVGEPMKVAGMAVGAQGGGAATLPFAPQSMSPSLFMDQGGILQAQPGGTVPGEPKFNHNTTKNDVVPAMLTPKEIVLPIEVTQAKNAPELARDFVAKELAKHGEAPESDFKGAIERGIKARGKKK